MSILTEAHTIMGVEEENSLQLADKVSVGKTGQNYLYRIMNPNMKVGMVYDFDMNIDRRRATKVSYTDWGKGEFALFGHYKNTTRIITEGQFSYRKYKDNIGLLIRIPLTDKVDFEFLEKACFEIVVKGLEESEELAYLGTKTMTLEELQKEGVNDGGIITELPHGEN